MSSTTRTQPMFSLARLMSHLQAPLYRNGYALVLSSGVTSGFGVLYWIMAARLYPAEIVGLNSAILAAITLLANLSQLNMMNALNRFLPSAGRASGRLIISAYLISILLAGLVSLIFLAGIDFWSPTLAVLKSNLSISLLFTVATMAWCIFVLQDSALTGLRQATWVPLENTIFSVAKILFLVALVSSLTQFGIIVSWMIPLIVLLIPTNILIFRYLLPRHVRASAERAEPIIPKQIAAYVAGDYLSSLVWMATLNILPLLVVERAGVEANAYFFLAWTIAYSLYLVSRNMGQSLIAEAAAHPTQLMAYTYRTFLQTTRLVVPLVGLLVIAAPYILWLFGQDYASAGTSLLRLLCLAAVPNIVTNLYISVARVQRRMMAIVVVLSTVSILVLGLSYILLDTIGIVGVGWAWLVSQTIIALILLLTELRPFWLARLKVQPLLQIVAGPRRLWNRLTRRQAGVDQVLLADILSRVELGADIPPPSTWQVRQRIETVNEVIVTAVGPDGQAPLAIVKIAQSQAAGHSLQRHRDAVLAVRAEPHLADCRSLLPAILADGVISRQAFLVEERLPGIDARCLMQPAETRQRVQTAAMAVISRLHQGTATVVEVDEALLKRWVDEPLQLIRQVKALRRPQFSYEPAFDHLAATLRPSLSGSQLALSWVHGDFVPGNILVTPDGVKLTGIVDWELARVNDLPQLDVALFLIASRMIVQRCDLGDVVKALLQGEGWSRSELAFLEGQEQLPGERIEARSLILLCWLRHIAANLTKSTRYGRHPLWISKNIELVLQSL